MDDIYLKVCHATKRVLFALERFPVFNHDYIKKTIDKPTTSSSECREYYLNSHRAGVVRTIIVILIYFAYTIKDFVIPFVTFSLFDHLNLEDNLQLVHVDNNNSEIPSQWLKFSCIMTNCSRLSDIKHVEETTNRATTLATDLSKLPMFMICHPFLDLFYTPVTKLDAFGLLAFCLSGFGAWLFGSLFPIQQLLYPASNEMIMFIIAPKVTTEIMTSRARRIFVDLSISYHNLRLNLYPIRVGRQIQRRIELAGLHGTKDIKAAQLLFANDHLYWRDEKQHYKDVQSKSIIEKFEQYHDDDVDSKLIGFNGDLHSNHQSFLNQQSNSNDDLDRVAAEIIKKSCLGDKSDKQIDQVLVDCLPSIRSTWWRLLSAQLFTVALIASLTFIFFIGSFSFYALNLKADEKQVLLNKFAQEMNQQGCSIFRLNDQELLNTTLLKPTWNDQLLELKLDDLINNHTQIFLDKLDLKWGYYAAWETSFLNFLPGFSIAVMFAYYYCIMSEISCLLAESRSYLVACVAFTRAQTYLKTIERNNTTARNDLDHGYLIKNKFFQFETLKCNFIKETFFRFYMFLLCRIKLPNNEEHVNTINAKENDILRSERYMSEFCSLDRLPNSNRDINIIDEELESEITDERDGKNQSDEQNIVDTSIETLEKVYVNFRLFVDHVRDCTRSIEVVITVIYLLNFGCLLIAILLSRKIRNFINEPIYVVIFSFFVGNILIVLASNFHASVSIGQSIDLLILFYFFTNESLILLNAYQI